MLINFSGKNSSHRTRPADNWYSTCRLCCFLLGLVHHEVETQMEYLFLLMTNILKGFLCSIFFKSSQECGILVKSHLAHLAQVWTLQTASCCIRKCKILFPEDQSSFRCSSHYYICAINLISLLWSRHLNFICPFITQFYMSFITQCIHSIIEEGHLDCEVA